MQIDAIVHTPLHVSNRELKRGVLFRVAEWVNGDLEQGPYIIPSRDSSWGFNPKDVSTLPKKFKYFAVRLRPVRRAYIAYNIGEVVPDFSIPKFPEILNISFIKSLRPDLYKELYAHSSYIWKDKVHLVREYTLLAMEKDKKILEFFNKYGVPFDKRIEGKKYYYVHFPDLPTRWTGWFESRPNNELLSKLGEIAGFQPAVLELTWNKPVDYEWHWFED